MKVSRRSLMMSAAGAAAIWSASLVAVHSAPRALAARTDEAGGVRVVVKPKSVLPGAVWTFEVAMDTHVKPLESDMTKSAALIVGKARYSPVSWKGDAAGGHHRKGTLSFPAPAEPAASFTLEFDGIGGVAKRSFSWPAP